MHVSTDEVFGDLESSTLLFTEKTAYAPSSPYSASKASSDHLVRAWHRTYGVPILITHCSNNYGRYQFPEKLIPLTILHAIHGKPIPIYGSGMQIRDWLFVEDHVQTLYEVLKHGCVGESYNISGGNEQSNLQLVESICSILNKLKLDGDLNDYPQCAKIDDFNSLVTFVSDRLGHDFRYGINSTKIVSQLGWKPKANFEQELNKTVNWYIKNRDWWQPHFK